MTCRGPAAIRAQNPSGQLSSEFAHEEDRRPVAGGAERLRAEVDAVDVDDAFGRGRGRGRRARRGAVEVAHVLSPWLLRLF